MGGIRGTSTDPIEHESANLSVLGRISIQDIQRLISGWLRLRAGGEGARL